MMSPDFIGGCYRRLERRATSPSLAMKSGSSQHARVKRPLIIAAALGVASCLGLPDLPPPGAASGDGGNNVSADMTVRDLGTEADARGNDMPSVSDMGPDMRPPDPIVHMESWTTVSVGGAHVCALDAAGAVFC